MKQQVFVIHGGDAFDTYEEYIESLKQREVSIERTRTPDWKGNLATALGDSYDVVLPRMPNPMNARYAEWKIIFDKYVSLLDEGVIFIGHSLGGIFLAKYLSEEVYPKSIKATLLVAAPYNALDENPYVDFNILTNLSGLEKQGGKVFLYHSKDDEIVPFSSFERYQRELPTTITRVFTDRQHFNQSEFPELVEDIRSL
jgi:predicted alpha/beta hydrolase family esterase